MVAHRLSGISYIEGLLLGFFIERVLSCIFPPSYIIYTGEKDVDVLSEPSGIEDFGRLCQLIDCLNE